jgi:hypothetical protein
LKRQRFIKILKQLHACEDAVKWVEKTAESPSRLWKMCDRGDWMSWLAIRAVERKKVIWVICQCVRPILDLVPKNENRPRIAIETVEEWTRGEAVIEQVRIAAYAANAIDTATFAMSAAAAAAVVAAAAADAAVADAAVADAAVAVAEAVTYDAYAAAAVAVDATERKYPKQSAQIVRQHITWSEIEAGLEKIKVAE